MNDCPAPFSARALIAVTLMLGAGPASAFNVSGFEFPDLDRSLAQRPADAGRAVYYDDVITSYWTEIGRYFKDRNFGTPVPLPVESAHRCPVGRRTRSQRGH